MFQESFMSFSEAAKEKMIQVLAVTVWLFKRVVFAVMALSAGVFSLVFAVVSIGFLMMHFTAVVIISIVESKLKATGKEK